jgi:hypothetical protein
MENIKLSKAGEHIHIEGFPDAVAVVALVGHKARRLADLALHQADLEFANECLDCINHVPEEPHSIREGLWRAAIIHYMKCFGDGARFQLAAESIYKKSPQALENYRYFKALRNKHFVHDENSYAQANPGAILNDGTKSYKVEKIVCSVVLAETLEQDAYANLKLLISHALAWVVAEFDALCVQLTNELDAKSYEELASMPTLTTEPPKLEEITTKREAL